MSGGVFSGITVIVGFGVSGGSGDDADMIVRVLSIHKVVDADVTVIQKSHLAEVQ